MSGVEPSVYFAEARIATLREKRLWLRLYLTVHQEGNSERAAFMVSANPYISNHEPITLNPQP